MKFAVWLSVLLSLSGCKGRSNVGSTSSSATNVALPKHTPFRQKLVVWAGAHEIGSSNDVDDGSSLQSEIELAGTKSSITITQAPYGYKLTKPDGSVLERKVDPKTVILANGHWQGVAFATANMQETKGPEPIKIHLANADRDDSGTVEIARLPDGTRSIKFIALGIEVDLVVDGNLQVVRGAVPAQGLEILREGALPSYVAALNRPAPQGIAEESLAVDRSGVAIRGTLWYPEGTSVDAHLPTVLLVAGSGPTDRDGNNAMGLKTDSYRLIAEGLARHGVAVARFDKRGVGLSGTNFKMADSVFRDFSDDVRALLAQLRSNPRVGPVTLLGHSEGGIMVLDVAKTDRVDGLILAASPGRTLATVVREQLARQSTPALMTEIDRILSELRASKIPTNVPPQLAALFNPGNAKYLTSEMDIDPSELLRGITVPVLIVQGETDIQVTPVDANALSSALPSARKVMFPQVNHVLKKELVASVGQASYKDPTLPLADGVIQTLLSGVAGVGGGDAGVH